MTQHSRRQFLKFGLMACAAGMTGLPMSAMARTSPARALGFYNTHTGERVSATYWEHGRYLPDALDEINHVLRDHRNGVVAPVSPKLLDLLHRLNGLLDSQQPMHVISGYRSPESNAMLARRSGGVAKHSLHMDGKAIDIRVPGRQLKVVRHAALGLQGGGVGYYPGSDFVHMDIGRVRQWQG